MRNKLIEKFWRGKDPFSNFPDNLYSLDLQGWGSEHPYLTQLIENSRPSVVVEVGVWKGGSTIKMAKEMKERNLDSVVIAVDTWLGAWDHWVNDEWFNHLIFQDGQPMIMKNL
jgi:tRNA G46 methylase TrmB